MISSTSNPVIRRVRRLRKRAQRQRAKRFLVEGHRSVRAALEAGVRLAELLYTEPAARLRTGLLEQARAAGVASHQISTAVMAHLTSVFTAPDVMATAPLNEVAASPPFDGVLMVGVHDPATAGSIMATASATGARLIVAGPGTVDLFDPKTVRSAHGAHFTLDVARVDDVEDLLSRARAAGTQIVALREKGLELHEPTSGRALLLIIDPAERWANQADAEISVPFSSVEPPLAVRAGVALYQLRREP